MKADLIISGLTRSVRYSVCPFPLQDIISLRKTHHPNRLLNIVEDEFDLYRVIDKKLMLPLGQRLFGCGTVVINVKDVDTPVKTVKSVKAPRKMMELLDAQVDKMRDAYGIRGRDMNEVLCHHDDIMGDDGNA